MNTDSITLALPAYNEQANIVKVLDDSVKSLCNVCNSWEILVIDNCSNDNTSLLVENFALKVSGVRLIRHDENLLYSGSCATAIKEAKMDYIAIMDSDGQFVATDIQKFINKLKSGANFVNGWRRKRNDPVLRLLASMLFNAMGRYWLKCPLNDLNCGIRMFDRKFLEVAVIKHRINMSNPELYTRAKLSGLKIDEVEIEHHERFGGTTSHNFLKSIALLFQVNKYMKSLSNELSTLNRK